MRLSRFMSITSFVTALSLLYVYQQTEIYRLAYLGQKKQVIFEDSLDKNTILRYNISKNASLTRIGDKISGQADFQMPDSYRLVKLTGSRQSSQATGQLAKKETILSRLFGVKNQAEARTLNP